MRFSTGFRVFFDQILERIILMRQFCIHPLVLTELSFHLLELLQLGGVHATILALPIVKRSIADLVLAADLLPATRQHDCQAVAGCHS